MKRNLPALLVLILFGCADVVNGQAINDPARIEIYVTPYYNSEGPTINVGPFSKGLGANSEREFVGTIAKMKQSWNNLSFPEMYVGAIRLYDRGFRKGSIYWFYSAQYQGRLVATLLDREKNGQHRVSRIRIGAGIECLPAISGALHKPIWLWRYRSAPPNY